MLLDLARGQRVAAVVVGIVRVALDLDPLDAVDVAVFQQRLPQVLILHGFLVGLQPATLLPVVQPALAEGVHQIGAVGIDPHLAGLLQFGERLDWGQQLHAVVGGVGLIAGQFQLLVPVHQYRAPAARAGVAGARAVGIDRDRFHALVLFKFTL